MRIDYARRPVRMKTQMPITDTTTPEPGVRTARATKRATNLSLSADVLEAAKRLQINVSQVCDNHLRAVVRQEQERRWRQDHADFISAYNATIEAEGLPLDQWRSFRWHASTFTPIRARRQGQPPIFWMCKVICSTAWTAAW